MAAAKEFKVVLAGQFGSGKTTFATRIKSAKSDKKEIKALKTTQYPVTLQTSAGQVTLNLFDTNLHAKGGLPDDGFFRTADASIVFFDLTNEGSYTAMEDWYDAVIKANGRKGSEPLPVVVVGTKADDIKVRSLLFLAPLFAVSPRRFLLTFSLYSLRFLSVQGRDIKPAAIEFPRKKEHTYREISAQAK